MKLCYVWLEKYRGFSNQGFNLTSEFSFEYDHETFQLTRVENSTYLADFFGKGVVEVTGIIGKNASGKTNILEMIQYVVAGANTMMDSSFFAVLKEGQQSFIYQYGCPDINNNFKGKLIDYKRGISDLESVFFSNVFDGRRHNFDTYPLMIC